jgi:hypothetical protein
MKEKTLAVWIRLGIKNSCSEANATFFPAAGAFLFFYPLTYFWTSLNYYSS